MNSMEVLDADSGVFSTSSCAADDSLTSSAPSVRLMEGFPTIAVDGEDAARRMSELNEMVHDMRLRSQWEQTVELYGGSFASSGEVTPRSGTPPGRLTAVDSKSLKRSVSARSSLKSVGLKSPRRKKMVRFADSLGLDLEHIRHILADDLPSVPNDPSEAHPFNSSVIVRAPRSSASCSSAVNGRYLLKRFVLPDGYNISKLVDTRSVCLESLTILDLSVTGVIRVANIAFAKQVHLRYTLDCWATWTEVRASFIGSSAEGAHDLFSFSLFLPYDLPGGSRCEFCIRYSVDGRQLWDNNAGANYALDCCSSQSSQSSSTNQYSTTPTIDHGWSHFFY